MARFLAIRLAESLAVLLLMSFAIWPLWLWLTMCSFLTSG